MPNAPVYRRTPGSVFRWMRGSVLVGGPGRPTQRLDGAAALVWMVLDSPATPPDMDRRIQLAWPDVGRAGDTEVGSVLVAEAIALLVAAELITTIDPQDPDRVAQQSAGLA